MTTSSPIPLFMLVAGVLPWALALAGVEDPALVAAFHPLCHQIPERALVIWGVPMLVCSRCAGIYAGVALGVLRPLPMRWLPHAPRLLAIATTAMVVEVVAQDVGLHPPWHVTRTSTGIAFGWVASAWMCRRLALERCSNRHLPRHGKLVGAG